MIRLHTAPRWRATLLACAMLVACTAPESAPTAIAPTAEPLAARPAASPYTVTELGTVGAIRSSYGIDVNDQGVVAGYAIDDAAARAFVLLGGQLVPLTESSDSYAMGVSNGDPMYVVGRIVDNSGSRAARWTITGGVIGAPVLGPPGGSMEVNDLGDAIASGPTIWRQDNSVVQVPPPGDFQYLDGRDIDDAGLSTFTASGSPTSAERAFLRLVNGTMVRLDPPAGRESYGSWAGGLNEPDGNGNVLVAGTIRLDALTTYPVRWTVNVATQQVAVWADFRLTGGAGDVSAAGTLAGGVGRHADSDGYLWLLDGTRISLPTPRGGQDAYAVSISENGVYATGYYLGRQGQRALLWSRTAP